MRASYNMNKHCKHCNKDFEARRSTAKYCSPKCRVYHNRGLSVTVSVTDDRVSVTVEDVTPIRALHSDHTPKGRIRTIVEYDEYGNEYTDDVVDYD